VTTRIATPADVIGLTDLINRAYDQAERSFVDGARITPTEVCEHMARGVFLVADDLGDAPYACVYLKIAGGRALLGLLAVDPRRQRQGAGAALLDAAEAYCRAQRCTAIDIFVVNLRTELFPRYEARGFHRTGTAPFDDPRLTQAAHFVAMSKSLT
jgi:GNAT superfamily N-acetyltransferase